MALNDTLSTEELLAQPSEGDTGKPLVSTEELLGGSSPTTNPIRAIPDEHKSNFLRSFGDAVYNGFIKTGTRLGGEVNGAVADINDVIGTVTGLNAFQEYRKNFVDAGRDIRTITRGLTVPENTFEHYYYGFIDAVGGMTPTLPFDVMTGGATKAALTGRILPEMEALLTRIPNFALGSGWRGMVTAINNTEGSIPEKAVAGVLGGAENVAINTLYASAGIGLKGIGKMAAMGLAQSFYGAAKEGRMPTQQEMADNTAQAALLGVVFTALPHLAEGSQIRAEKATLKAYSDKFEKLVMSKDVRTYSVNGETWYHGGAKGLEGDLVGGMVTRNYDEAARYAKEVNGQVYEVPSEAVIPAKQGDVNNDGQPLGNSYKNFGFVKSVAKGQKGWAAKVATESSPTDPSEIHQLATDLLTDERIRPEIRESLLKPFMDKVASRNDVAPQDFKLGLWKDPSKLGMMRETMERIIENVAGPDATEVKADTTEMIKENETYRKRWESTLNNAVQDELFIPKGIKPNSPDSALTMRYGEGRMSLDELKAASPKNWGNIKKAAEFSRWVYDDTIDGLNTVREAAGKEPIQKVPNYFRHFQEISAATKLFGHFFGGDKTPTSIAGVINRTKYGSPFNPTEMHRLGGEFTEDAVLALQNYVKSVGPQLFHTDSVQRVRTLERYIRSQALISETSMKEGKPFTKVDLSNFVGKLTSYGDLLAGQPTKLTQALNDMAVSDHWLDRTVSAGIRGIQRNVTLNMIGHNIAAGTMNILPLAQQLATTNPKYVAKGWTTSGLHLLREVPFEIDGARSEFYDRRYPKGFLPANWYENIVDKGFILPNFIDRMTVQSLIAGKYYEGREQGLDPATAMKGADNYAARAVQDRSTGQVPQIMSEPDLRLISAFQVEINNLWSWLAKDVKAQSQGDLKKTIGKIAVFALASNVINNVYEKAIGRRPQLDFMYILATLAGKTQAGANRDFLERVEPAARELLGNVPFGNLFVKGGRIPMASVMPDMEKVMGDPEHTSIYQIAKPLSFMLPFGGMGQVWKTSEGLQAWNQGYVATPSGKNIRYDVTKDFYNFVRGFLFGKNAFPEAVRYWRTPKDIRSYSLGTEG